MEVKELFPFVILIVAVGMLIGIGIITLDAFGGVTYYTRSDYNDTITIANYTAQKLDYGNITVSAVWNDTFNELPSTCYEINTTPGTFIWNNGSLACDVTSASSFYMVYDFKEYATETRDATNSVSSEISNIATDWLGLIVTIFILAIILFLVIRSFGMAQR